MMTDHAEMMGTAPMLTVKGSALYDTSARVGEIIGDEVKMVGTS